MHALAFFAFGAVSALIIAVTSFLLGWANAAIFAKANGDPFLTCLYGIVFVISTGAWACGLHSLWHGTLHRRISGWLSSRFPPPEALSTNSSLLDHGSNQ